MTEHVHDDQVGVARQTLPLIDLTLLGDDDTNADIDVLCADASTPFGTVAAVCVWPQFVARACENVSAVNLPVAGVANFPLGEDNSLLAVDDALRIVAAGGREVDVVYPWRNLQRSGHIPVSKLVKRVRSALPDSAVLKVILETGELADPELIRLAALDSIESGADFLKTSTGKTGRSATPDAVRQLCEIVRDADRRVGVKVSGGVRTVTDAQVYLDIAEDVLGSSWIRAENFRIGASALLGDVISTIEQAPTVQDS